MKTQFLLLLALSLANFVVAQNVGIGTITPQAKLHVNGGDVLFTGKMSATGVVSEADTRFNWLQAKSALVVGVEAPQDENVGELSLAFGGPGNYARGLLSFAFGQIAEANNSNAFAFGTNVFAQREHSRAWGYNVVSAGVNATAIGTNLSVKSYASVALGRFNINDGHESAWVSTDPALVVGNGTSEDDLSNAFTLYKNGDLLISGGLSVFSDANLKKDLTKVTGSLHKIAALSGYTYLWKNEAKMGNALHAGLLAQEVQAQMPELVKENENKELSVNYNGMIPYLVEAIKELKAENEALRLEVQQLKSK